MHKAILIFALCTLLPACEQATPPVTVHSEFAIPDRLSDWGIVFVDGRHFELNDGVIPYDLNTPLFSDYALKLRTVWLPEGTAAQYNDNREFDFPIGTIISKTFHYEKADGWSTDSLKVVKVDREAMLDDQARLDLADHVLIETRLLVRYADGWKALPYVWNRAQDEAFLELAGDDRSIELIGNDDSETITYIVPDANQCGGCHTPDHRAKELRPIGPRAWQLNREHSYRGEVLNQLDRWSALGLLTGAGAAAPTGVRWARPGDATLERRAKAYLDANCAHCHNATGSADTSGLYLNIEAPVDRAYGICKPPVAVGRGSGDRPYDIYPGRPDDSILVYRMQHSDPAIVMPELGRSAVHAEGVKVISDWIAGMNGDC